MKWSGKIGFVGIEAGTGENRGIYSASEIVERRYSGDLKRTGKRVENTQERNSDVVFTNEISIIADPFINSNLYKIAYATFMGAKWKITNVSVDDRRLNLTLGGVYHEEDST